MIPSTFFLLFCLASANVVSADEHKSRRFFHRPGDFAVLGDTKAVFDWRHTISNLRNVNDEQGVNKTVNDIAVSWFYLGKNREQFTLIMAYTSTDGPYIASSDKAGRISYTEGLDSAVMHLDKVTPLDEGFYEVRVVDTKDPVRGGFYISDVAMLTVVKASEVQFNVTVRNQTFDDLDLANGNDIRLATLPVSIPERVYVSISVSQTAPLSDIRMTTTVGDITRQELPCWTNHFCERNIPLMSKDDTRQGGRIEIVVSPKVQNIGEIHTNVALNFDSKLQSRNPANFSNSMLITLVISCLMAVVGVVFFILAWIRWTRDKRPKSSSPIQTGAGPPLLHQKFSKINVECLD